MRRRRFPSPLAQGGLLLLGGLLVGLLALLLKDFVRESILAPLTYTVSGARAVLNVVPQVVWWVAFLLIALFIVIGAVLVALPAPRWSGAPDEPRRGRVETWMRWIDLAAGGGDRYSRQNLARRVRDLALGALAARDGSASLTTSLPVGVTRAEVESRLRSHALRAPPDVESQLNRLLEFDSARDPSAATSPSSSPSLRSGSESGSGLQLRAGLAGDGGRDRSRTRAWLPAPVAQAQVSEIDIERIVRYLEDEMEVPRGD
ncbi:MAG TPA: hypothetical protein VFL17_19270 [Anaerolineae bacterium]|nr:hypothetical protein [Anaerolineae bacterium]